MLGKLVVHASDRAAAIARLDRALSEYEVGEVATTLLLFRALASDPEFAAARFDVQWLDRRLGEGLLGPAPPAWDEALLGAVGLALGAHSAAPRPLDVSNDSAWRHAGRQEAMRRGPR
jgi:acetyl-CoA carboxylase biotin carboxylase subunit